ncbi:MAG: DUF5134 domain-containing protein [Acidimicrobiales bacterium]
MGPAWLDDLLAVVMVAVAAVEVGRLSVASATGRPSERDVDAFHLAMGVSMAGMLTGHLSPFAAQAWAVVFGGSAVWFACRVPWAVAATTHASASLGHRTTHVASSLAMVYMLLAVGTGPGTARADGAMAAMSSGGHHLPVLSILLAVALLVGVAHAGRAGPGVGALDPSVADAGDDVSTTAVDGTLVTATTTARARIGTRSVPFLAPRLASACEVAMGAVMVYMLLSIV